MSAADYQTYVGAETAKTCVIFRSLIPSVRRCSRPAACVRPRNYFLRFRPKRGCIALSTLPPGISEYEIVDYFNALSRKECVGYWPTFLGAGVYNHYRPVVVDTVVSRGEFLTSYTPYQSEISQGTLTTIFEFQTMICQLTGMDVANASMYDGSTAVPEAAMMAVRVTGRHRILVARSVHPEYREVLRTYAKNQGLPVEEFGYDAEIRADRSGGSGSEARQCRPPA